MSAEAVSEDWQVEAGDEIFVTNLTEMTGWIAEGSLLRIDRVRKGNLRWIEAGKVPTLAALFDQRDQSAPKTSAIVTTSDAATQSTTASPAADPTVGSPDACTVHPDARAAFECDTCGNQFCKACPNSYGGTVKICPFCGAMCRPVSSAVPASVRSYAPTSEFGLGDLVTALGYPLRFPASLIMGGIIFAFLSLGKGVGSLGGSFMIWGAIACGLLANTLTFGILANTVENFSQGKLDENFMPSFDNFSLWEDAVHPFFLMLGVNLISFGPLAAVVLFAIFALAGSVPDSLMSQSSTPSGLSQTGTTVGSANRGIELANIARQQAAEQDARVRSFENGLPSAEQSEEDEDARQSQAAIEKFMSEAQRQEAAPAADRSGDIASRAAELKGLMRYGLLLIAALIVTGLWGLIYFPAANAVAGYTRSLSAVLNPTVGLDTIRRLGSAYAKVLLMFFLLALLTGISTIILNTLFAPLDLPMLGNIPANAVNGFISFFLSIVFSCVIGLALYKRADRLQLPQ